MASSKKTSPSRSKSAKSKATDSKIEEAVAVEDETVKPVADDQATDSKDAVTGAPDEKSVEKVDAVATDSADLKSIPEEKPATPLEEPAENKAKPEPDRAVMVAPVPAIVEERRNSFLPLVLGGIIAGVIGFVAAEMGLFGKGDADITTKLRSDLNTQQERLVALETADAPEVDLAPIQDQLTTLESRIAALEDRPVAVMPGGGDGEEAAAYAAELKALKASVQEQRGEIEALLNNAKSVEQATADAAKAATIQAAVARIVSAIDAGQPFAEPVAVLAETGEVDPALSAPAAEGVATLSALQAEFPDQARTALAAARASGVEEGQQGLGGFLTRALGARSVAPREGNDPDAVLSRAEAAIKTGDLNATLTELDTLPEEAQAAIADWRAAADARVAARAAADALAQRLTAD